MHTFYKFFLCVICGTSLCNAQPSIIIIGAGPSGVAAATRLLENNLTNITILEAEARIGGRIRSVMFGDAFVDLGAHWCHGEKDNVVYNLVKDLNVLGRGTDDSRVLYSSGSVSAELNNELLSAVGATFSLNTKGVKVPVEEYYIGNYNKSVDNNFGNDSARYQIARDTGRLLKQLILAHRGSFTLNDVIVDRDYKICEGDLRLNWNGNGYRTILDVMIKKYPDPSKQLPFYEKLLLNKEVSNIKWNDGKDSGVLVKTTDGSVYVADYVIFTPSVGVLKHSHEELFSPALPEEKVTAIHDIGLGAIMDVSLYFPQRWWPSDNFTGYYFVWNEQDAEEFIKEKNGSFWILDLFNLTPNEKNPNVLTIWITGTSVPQAEELSDEELINGTLFVLNKFLGQEYNITVPTSLVRSDWYKNPHFKGTYSYQTKRAHDRTPSAEVVLSEPLKNKEGGPVVLFAGEATHPYYYSTVHGATESGYREADRLIKSVPQ